MDRRAQQYRLWQSAHLTDDPAMLRELHNVCNTIMKNWDVYKKVGDAVNGIPPYVIGALHYRESSFDFASHLANGDPLWNSDGVPLKTRHVPQGLGPYDSWVSGAIGALRYEGFDRGYHWDLANALENMHMYNGWGPEKYHGVNSGYVWAGTNHYSKGMYVADGQWDASAVDRRPGCAAILLALRAQGVDLNDIPLKA